MVQNKKMALIMDYLTKEYYGNNKTIQYGVYPKNANKAKDVILIGI